ncbi:conjugal transfer protein TraN [Novosphingobium sp. 9U]|uniref:conjugal transfer protein TraN n=1 Tax=Novosphingobium sp. 9U TaxID=2653158 RepID=UPI0012F2ADC1|nr:conjugal transfer protein TraN [Novosphingobium sp. 9U]VWX49856.1 IncF plasmid conjugative transfer protein TraN [Novosphingobium sp. 9U]
MARCRFHVCLTAALATIGSFASEPSYAQDRAAAEAAAKEVGAAAQTMGKTIVMDAGSPESLVPGYAGTELPQAELIDDPDHLSAKGTSAASSDPAYATVINPTRPVFDPLTIDVSGAQAVEQDPDSFLGTGVNLDGSAGSCEPVPESGSGPSTYYETCNRGDQIITTPRTCTSSLNVRFDRITTWIYYSATQGPYASRAVLAPAIADGTCKSKGAFNYCTELSRYGYSAAGSCKPNSFSPEIFECTREIGGMTATDPSVFSGIVKATGQYWASKSETVSPPIITRSYGACAAESNAQCVEQGTEVCTSSDPESRIIDGIAVTQPCWAWQRNFRCTERRSATDCGELEKKPDCHFDHDECLSENPDGSCNIVDKVYACTTPDTRTGSGPAFICNGDLYCINGECTKIEREASTEFKDAMVAVHTLGEVRDDFDPATVTLFNGEKTGCHKPVFGLVNCCAGKTSGLITTATGAAAIAYGPAAIAALATPFLTMFLCSSEEKLLDVKDRMGLCHYVGTYCSDSVLGVCTSKRKSYCCFQSKLARILQEQGRAQIGKPWGKPNSADCKGFTIDEFGKLDLSKMDFTEVYDEFMDAAKVPDEVQASIDVQKKIEEYYKLHAGR